MGPSDIAMLCILFVLLFLSAFFSSAETALTTVSRMKLRMLVDEGKKSAIVLDKVLENRRKMLSMILISNNIVNLAASAVTTVFTQNVFHLGWPVSIGVGIITFLIIMFGEIIPKTIAAAHADSVALKYARIIKFLMTVLTPLIVIIDGIATGILKIFRIKTTLSDKSFTEGELRTIVDVSQEEGLIEEEERDMINNVFDFGETSAKDIMVPEVDITMVPVDIEYEELLKVVKETKYTRYPVFEESHDNVVGILNIKDLFIEEIGAYNFNMKKIMREPFFTYDTIELNDLLVEMRDNVTGMCIVLDEYGQVDGMITLEDIIEEIVGEIRDEFDEAEEQVIKKINDNTYIVQGSINLDDFNDEMGTDIDSEEYESLGGLIIERLERLPEKGDSVMVDNCKFTVVKLDGNRIVSVKARIMKPTEPEKEQTD